MFLECLEVGPLAVNCYLIGDEATKEAVVVDPGGNVDKILQILNFHNYKVKYIIDTHGHFDHVSGNAEIKAKTGAPIIAHEAEVPLLAITHQSPMAQMFGGKATPPPDITVKEGDVIEVGSIKMSVLYTPGHTPGGMTLVFGNYALVGDCVFAGSIGRTDFPNSDHETLINSIQNKIMTLPEETILLPGHGPYTTVGDEKRYNPFL